MSEVSLVLARMGARPGDRRGRRARSDADELRPGDRHRPLRVRADERTGGPPYAERRRTRAEERADEIDPPTALLATIEELTAEKDAATKVSEDYLVALQRARRVRELQAGGPPRSATATRLAAEDLIRKVLNLADDFDRPSRRRIDRRRSLVRRHRRHRPALRPARERRRPDRRRARRPFDPREHEAIASVPGTGHRKARSSRPPGAARLRDRPAPALVAVAAAPTTNDIDPTTPTH